MGVRELPSGRHQARFRWRGRDYAAVLDTSRQAQEWIRRTRGELVSGTYLDPVTDLPADAPPATPTLAEYAATWLAGRDLKPRSRANYVASVATFGDLAGMRLEAITLEHVKAWHASLTPAPVQRKKHYEALRAIMNGAVADEHLAVSPVRVAGATKQRPRPKHELPTAATVHALADAMPSPAYRCMTLVAAWCGVRFGELTELRRGDVLLDSDGTPLALKVRRAAAHVKGAYVVGTPKSAAGVRDLTIPPHIRPDLAEHLATLPADPRALLFPGRSGGHMAPSSLYRVFYRARAKVGLTALRWHDLRHWSATEYARQGATLAELQHRLGHSTVTAALTYQHAAQSRDVELAERMSASNVVRLRPAL